MIDVEIFQENDLPHLLELCNTAMEYDQLNETLLREKIFEDPQYNPEMVLIVREGSEIVGFMIGVVHDIRDERIGFIKLMAVAPDYRRRGIARKMLRNLETIFREIRVQKMRIYDAPMNYFQPGIDPRYTAAISFAEAEGFSRFTDTANMTAPLSGQDFSTDDAERQLEKDNITIERAGYDDRTEILEFIDEQFPLWRYEVNNMYNSLPVSLHIARQNGIIKAFSGHNGNNFGTGWFGPMGTHPDLRGKGVGGILLKRCLRDMQEWGLEKTVIPWVGPIRFYSHYVKAVVERVFWRYEKNL